jgi:hypothetical protein
MRGRGKRGVHALLEAAEFRGSRKYTAIEKIAKESKLADAEDDQ